ncbi:MAG: hypothetical protein JWN04_6402 [Myxococcaceae bacterium]|nr:hypothetical protein [Myxococcaceae bacterium]
MTRRLMLFFVLGALLLGAKRGLSQSYVRARELPLQVVIKDSAGSLELERAIDEAVLVEHAVSLGGALIDPVVREQLLSSMRGRARVETATKAILEDDAALLQPALALGLHRADVVTRQRLMFQAEQLLTASNASTPATDRELTAYLHAHAARYTQPTRFSFTQVALVRARHGARLAQDAASLLEGLTRQAPAEAQAQQGDPTLLPRSLDCAPAAALEARFGPSFGAALQDLPLDRWSGPVPSAYGLHLVFLRARSPKSVPALADIRTRVLADYRHDQRRELLRARVRALRGHYRIEVRRLHA